MPDVDPDDSTQNAFVQDWLSAWARQNLAKGDRDWEPLEAAIEIIQETYSA